MLLRRLDVIERAYDMSDIIIEFCITGKSTIHERLDDFYYFLYHDNTERMGYRQMDRTQKVLLGYLMYEIPSRKHWEIYGAN